MDWDDQWINDIWMHGSSDREGIPKKKKKRKGKKMNLQEGDRVRLQGGKRPLTVTYVTGGYDNARFRVTAQYDSGAQISRYNHEFVLLDEEYETESKGMDKMKGKLFQTKEETPRFGVGLAVNSKGEYVLEMKGTGELESFDKKAIEVVMPYSFAVKFSTSAQTYQYRGKAGSVAVGDLLLSLNSQHAKGGISIAQVVEVDTKSEKATKYFDGMKIVTTPLE